MKYNSHIFICTGIYFDLCRLWNLVFLFVLIQSLKTSTALLIIISMCRGGFHSGNKSCSIVFKIHMIPDYISIVYRVTRWHRPREDELVSNLARINTRSKNFTACFVYTPIVCWHFHTYTGKIFGSHAVTAL